MRINGTKLNNIVGPIVVYNGPDDVYQTTHLFCVTSIYSGMEIREDGKIFDPRVSGFGDTMLIIKPAPFMARVEKAVEKLKQQGTDIELFKGLVEYVPAGENQHQMSVLRKADIYAWQEEFRLALRVRNWHGSAFLLEIGSIADISHVVPIKKFINKVEELSDGQVCLNFS
ncbi:hypothetical protein LF95_15735 [Thalassospira sp. TSL5-1]|nr:hypothetical protein LF95_15735 [Thalassospira sp. TSL5-1]